MKSDIDVKLHDKCVLANGSKIEVLGTVDIKMTISGLRKVISCYVFKTASHPIILGMDYLRRNKINLDFAEMKATSKDMTVFCTKRVTVPPRSEMLVWGKVQAGVYGDQGICTSGKYLAKKGVLISKAVVTVTKERRVPIKVLNPYNDNVIIHKGKPLAQFSRLSTDQSIEAVLNSTSGHKVQNVKIITNEKSDKHSENKYKTDFIKCFDMSDSALNERQKSDFENFLFNNKDIFVTPDNPDLGFTDLVQHKIILKQDYKPKHQRPYRLPPDKREVLRHHLDELLAQGIICSVDPNEDLPITSPVVLVTKRSKRKSGSACDKESSLSQYRFCCDFRYLNSQCETFSYAIPDLQELTESFTERKPNFISSVDLSSGFFQMKIHPDSSKYTSFNTCYGTFKFQRLPMGLSSSPNSFQLLMDKVLRGLTFRSCLCYLDDVLICSETFDEHVTDLGEIFDRFRQAGLKLNPKKCSFMKNNCIFLGHHISSEGIKPPPDRVRALQEYPSPKNAKQLRRVLGLFNWFRKFIPQYSAVTQPLTKLLRKGAVFQWTNEHETAFLELKTRLLHSDVLAFPRFDIPFYLSVDTSAKGIGYMLYQRHPDKNGTEDKIQIIRFGSKSLNHWQKSYGPTKLELLGVVTSITDCSSYLRGNRFIVECDHQALRPLIEKQLKGAIYDRWLAILQQYNFDIRYKPAAQMQVPDALSRCMRSDASDGISSPEEADPFFPYMTEHSGKIKFAEAPRNTDIIKVNYVDIITDLEGYTADSEEDVVEKARNNSISVACVRRPTLASRTRVPTVRNIASVNFDISRNDNISDDSDNRNTCDNRVISNGINSEVRNNSISTNCVNKISVNSCTHFKEASLWKLIEAAVPKTQIENGIYSNSVVSKSLEIEDEIEDQFCELSVNTVSKNKTSEEDTATEENMVKETIELFKKSDFCPSSVKLLQRKDQKLQPIIDYLEHGTVPKLQREARGLIVKCADYIMSNDLLYHVRNAKNKRNTDHRSKYQLVLPNILVRPVLEQFHDSPMGGHGGIQATIDLITEHFYFEKLPSIVTTYVQSCHDCQTRKITKAHTKSGIISYKTPFEPFQVWQIDLFGPLPMSQRGHAYIFTATDMFSKYAYNVPIPNCDSMTVALVLFEMFCLFGVCDTLISDKGSEFISACTKEVCNLLAIRQNFTPSTIHHCLGLCERTHRTLAERLTPFTQKGQQWDAALPAVTFAMNSSVQASTKYSPFEIIFGTRPKFPLSNACYTNFSDIPRDFHEFIKEQSKRIISIREEVKDNSLKAGQLMTERCNKKINPLKLDVGDYVYMLADPTGQGRKLQPKYNGPYIVHSIVSDHIVKLRMPETGKVLKNDVHLDRLKIAYIRAPQPTDYFVPEVRTKIGRTGKVEPLDKDTTTDNQTVDNIVSESSDTDRSSSALAPLRRSTRVRKRPVRFEGLSFDNASSSDNGATTSDTYYKIKRILAQRTRDGQKEYKVQFKGEPAQNAMWIPYDQMNSHAKTVINRKPVPQLD